MKISAEALDQLIKHFEGLRLHAYPDPASGGEPWTIGYGHTGNVRKGDFCTEGAAHLFLLSDVQKFERAVEKLVNVPLTQSQFDALVSFTFNLGEGRLKGSTLLKKLNVGDYAGAAAEFVKWKKPVSLPGILRRRQAETKWFLKE